MKLADTARRAISVVLAAACFAVVPSIATASFTDRTSVSVAVGTATVPAPTDVTGVYKCEWKWLVIDGVTVSVEGVQHPMSDRFGLRYDYALIRPDGTTRSIGTGTPKNPRATLRDTKGIDFTDTTWTLATTASLFNWVGTTRVEPILCEAGSNKQVPF